MGLLNNLADFLGVTLTIHLLVQRVECPGCSRAALKTLLQVISGLRPVARHGIGCRQLVSDSNISSQCGRYRTTLKARKALFQSSHIVRYQAIHAEQIIYGSELGRAGPLPAAPLLSLELPGRYSHRFQSFVPVLVKAFVNTGQLLAAG